MIGVKTEEFVLFCLHFHYLCSRPNRSATARNEEHSSCIGRSAHTDTTNLSTNSTHGRTKRNPAARRNDIPHGRSFRQPLRKKLLQQGELILSDLNFDINAGEFVYLIGRVGSGKSSLLKTLYAELQLIEGEGYVAGFDLRKLKRRDIPMLRRRIGIVFQDYQLLTDRNVFMNLYYVMKATGWKNESEIRKRIDEVLKVVSLEAKGYKMPFELSGGEQQRLVIARALLNRPRLLLADEPTGNLDPLTAEGIIRLFQEIARQGCAVVMSTHNTALIEEYPSRTILFSKGKIKEVPVQTMLQDI